MQEILNPGRIAPRMVYTSISPVSITWIICGNYIQLSRFFMYPNTTAENFIARHVFIVSHPLQGHHQRYSSKPEIPPKADRRSTQSTMKSASKVRILPSHICLSLQSSNELFTTLPIPSLSVFQHAHLSDHSIFSRCDFLLRYCALITIASISGEALCMAEWMEWSPEDDRKMTMKSSEVVFPSFCHLKSEWNSESNRFRAAFISNWSIHDVTPKQLEGLVSTQKIRKKWLAQQNIHASKKLLLTIAWPNDSNFTNMRSMQAVQAVRFTAFNAPREASWPDRASLPFCLEN